MPEPLRFASTRYPVISMSIGAALLLLPSCKDPAEADLDRCIALEANQDWAGALDACANASHVAPDSNAGRLASGKAALLREKTAAKEAWEELNGTTSDGRPLPPDAEARRAVATLRTFWPIARRVGSANFQLAECQDTAKGQAAFKQCLDTATAAIARENALTQKAALPKGGCAQEIASAIAEYVSSNDKWITSFNAWVETHDEPVKRAMLGKPLTEACRQGLNCAAQDRSGPSFERVNGIECTKTVFACGAPDNVCWVNKVADRLGLADGRPGALSVRATGVAIR